MIKHPDLNWTTMISSSFLVMGLITIFFISIGTMKKRWIQDNKLLKYMGMKCNSNQDIHFASLKTWKNTFVLSSVIPSCLLTLTNIIVTLIIFYVYNGKSFDEIWKWFDLAIVLPLLYLFCQCTAIFIILKKYTNKVKANDLISFLQKYKPNMQNDFVEPKRIPKMILWRINRINLKHDVVIQSLLIASKYHSYNWKQEKTKKAKQLFDYILINIQ